jgi:hypothetical protein
MPVAGVMYTGGMGQANGVKMDQLNTENMGQMKQLEN